MRMKSICITVFLSVMVMSCKNKDLVDSRPAEESVTEEMPVELEMTEEELLINGYRLGTVTAFEGQSAPCDFQVVFAEGGSIEALNFPDDFKKDGLEVFVKYSPQRRRQMCGTAIPVDILDIKSRNQ